jgi:hypothetical protein
MIQSIRHFASLLGRALMLEPDPYHELKEHRNPFVEGLFLVVTVGLVVAIASIIGTCLAWASTPNLASIKQIVYQNLVAAPWYLQLDQDMGTEFVQQFKRFYDLGWQYIPAISGAPNPVNSLVNILLMPLGLIIYWLIYGVVAHLMARLLGGRGTMAQTFGCTALAVAPQLLNLATIVPFVVVGGVVGTWTLLCQYRGLKEAHALPWGRAFLATVLPLLILALVVIVLVSVIAVIIISATAAGRLSL